MLSHPMFLRSIIHLGLVREMSMHNGKNTPALQDGERGEQREDAGAEWIPASLRSGSSRGAGGGAG